MEIEKADVRYFDVPAGIICGCAKCGRVIKTGTWAVGIIIGEHKYIVGVNPRITCCGNEKQVIDCVDTEDEAKELRQRVIDQLDRDGTTANLVLYESFSGVSDALN